MTKNKSITICLFVMGLLNSLQLSTMDMFSVPGRQRSGSGKSDYGIRHVTCDASARKVSFAEPVTGTRPAMPSAGCAQSISVDELRHRAQRHAVNPADSAAMARQAAEVGRRQDAERRFVKFMCNPGAVNSFIYGLTARTEKDNVMLAQSLATVGIHTHPTNPAAVAHDIRMTLCQQL